MIIVYDLWIRSLLGYLCYYNLCLIEIYKIKNFEQEQFEFEIILKTKKITIYKY